MALAACDIGFDTTLPSTHRSSFRQAVIGLPSVDGRTWIRSDPGSMLAAAYLANRSRGMAKSASW